jgi:hypothetical protein
VLQIGLFVALVAPWHHTHRVRSWQRRRGGRNPERTPQFHSTENSEKPSNTATSPDNQPLSLQHETQQSSNMLRLLRNLSADEKILGMAGQRLWKTGLTAK